MALKISYIKECVNINAANQKEYSILVYYHCDNIPEEWEFGTDAETYVKVLDAMKKYN